MELTNDDRERIRLEEFERERVRAQIRKSRRHKHIKVLLLILGVIFIAALAMQSLTRYSEANLAEKLATSGSVQAAYNNALYAIKRTPGILGEPKILSVDNVGGNIWNVTFRAVMRPAAEGISSRVRTIRVDLDTQAVTWTN